MNTGRVTVRSLKVAVPLAADSLPRDLVPADGPAGEPVLLLVFEGGALAARARLNGKNYRRALKQIDELGPGNVSVVLQGVLLEPAGCDLGVMWRVRSGLQTPKWKAPFIVQALRAAARSVATCDGPTHHPHYTLWM
jgi:hypothetical protein